MKRFYRVVASEIVQQVSSMQVKPVPRQGVLARLSEFLLGSECKVVGSKCETGLPNHAPHSATYSYLTLNSNVHQLNAAYTAASNRIAAAKAGRS